MTNHVIIGGGPAATHALETIRRIDENAGITLISDEPAHSRMALPYWLCNNIPREHTLTADDAYYKKHNVTAKVGQRVASIAADEDKVVLADGEEIAFDKLLLATGSSPLPMPIPGSDLPGVQNLWSLADTDAAIKAGEGKGPLKVLFIGAGFIGFIVASAAHKRGWEITVVERDPQLLPRMLDADAASLVDDWLGKQGVKTHVGVSVQSIEADGDQKKVNLDNGDSLTVDLVVVAIGVQPNVDLAKAAGIDVDHGVLVNAKQETSRANVFAAGDVSQGSVLFQDEKEVHAIHPTAVDQGRVAGANMAGESIEYGGSLLMNVIDICGLQTVSYGAWNDDADATVIHNPANHIYRKLLWRDDKLVGAIFTGRARDAGLLTDIGMVKGILQTQTPLGAWKKHLVENPFDIRRAYIGAGIAQKLVNTTLLGRPAISPGYRFGNVKPEAKVTEAHAAYTTAAREAADKIND